MSFDILSNGMPAHHHQHPAAQKITIPIDRAIIIATDFHA